MSDCERDLESMENRADSSNIEVVRYHSERGGDGRFDETRPGGVVASAERNPRESEQACFRGKETLRKISR
jgi:hypothetical protein